MSRLFILFFSLIVLGIWYTSAQYISPFITYQQWEQEISPILSEYIDTNMLHIQDSIQVLPAEKQQNIAKKYIDNPTQWDWISRYIIKRMKKIHNNAYSYDGQKSYFTFDIFVSDEVEVDPLYQTYNLKTKVEIMNWQSQTEIERILYEKKWFWFFKRDNNLLSIYPTSKEVSVLPNNGSTQVFTVIQSSTEWINWKQDFEGILYDITNAAVIEKPQYFTSCDQFINSMSNETKERIYNENKKENELNNAVHLAEHWNNNAPKPLYGSSNYLYSSAYETIRILHCKDWFIQCSNGDTMHESVGCE